MTPTIHDQLHDYLETAQREAEVESLKASFRDGVAAGLRKALDVTPPDATELRAALVTYLTDTLPTLARYYEDNPQETPPAPDALRRVGYELHDVLEAYDTLDADADADTKAGADWAKVEGLFARENLRPALAEYYAEVREHIAACRKEVKSLRAQRGCSRLGRIIRVTSCQETFERVAHRLAKMLGTTYRPEDDDASGE